MSPGTTTARKTDLESRRVLSVSNLRHPLAKAILPQGAMLAIERFAQRPLGPLYFGPSVFFLAEGRVVRPGRATGTLTR